MVLEDTHKKIFDWQVSSSPDRLRQRSELLKQTRLFFEQRSILEIEVPSFCRYSATDPHTQSPTLNSRLYGRYYLQSSPEGWLKQYLHEHPTVDVFALSRVFRDDWISSNHAPEFLMLEWYRQGFGWEQLCEEVIELIMFSSSITA